MNLREVDLNLLVILDVLLEERKLVSAAKRLGLTQPSVSGALERCRRLFSDPLLVRMGRDMQLTARAQSLRAPIRELIERTGALLQTESEHISSVTRTVRIVASDIPALMLLKMLWSELQQSAPGINLILLHWRESDRVIDALERDDADLALSMLPQVRAGLRRTKILDDHYCIAMRRGHPAAENFNIDRWLAYPHIIVSARGAKRTPLDDQLELMGHRRRVGITVPSFLMVAPLLAASDLIAMLPRYCMPHEPGLLYFDPPIQVEGFSLHLATATRSDRDVAVQHVAELIRNHFPRST
jgi:DNA-binding transcriptional LysR family regulator